MTGTHSSGGIGESIRKGVGMIHGTGEAIRGNAMSAVDTASGDKANAVKNQEIANKGVDEWDRGYRGHAAGVTPADADCERLNTTHSTSTNYGAHNSNIGNKVDPRYDSDMDHRGTATDSTNVGPHSTNVSNKVDPRFDSDADHRANPASNVGGHHASFLPRAQTDGLDEYDHGPNPPHEHRGSIGALSGLEAAQKLDPIFGVGPDEESMKYAAHSNIHRLRGSISGASGLEAAQKLDPPDDVKARGAGHSHPDPTYHSPKPKRDSNVSKIFDHEVDYEKYDSPQREGTEVMREDDHSYDTQGRAEDYPPDVNNDELEHQSHHRRQPKIDPSASILSPKTMKSEERSTANPHKSDILNLLDPRIDRNSVRKPRQEDFL